MNWMGNDLPRPSDCVRRRAGAFFAGFRSTFHSGEITLRVYGMPLWCEDLAIPLTEDGDGTGIVPDGDATLTFIGSDGKRTTKVVRMLWQTGRHAREFAGIPVGEAAVTDAVKEWCEANWDAVEADAADKWRDGP